MQHTVAKGENLFRLSLRYGVRLASILEANGLEDADHLVVGQVLRIPKAGLQPQTTESANPKETSADHLVDRGENLYRISLRYGVPVQQIQEANGLSNPNLLKAGQRLVIPLEGANKPLSASRATVPQPEARLDIPGSDGWSGAFRITYYCLNGPMSSGRWTYAGAVAADTSIVPLGTQLVIEGLGLFRVEDRFAWDAGENRLDIWVSTCWEAVQRGVEHRRVRIVSQ
jgi:LysM repeat protein/3D (Asp-Asp-Asp) domain-containing protein